MKGSLKRALGMLLAAVLCLSLASCGMGGYTPGSYGNNGSAKPADRIEQLVIGTVLKAENVSILSGSGSVGALNRNCITDPALFVHDGDGRVKGFFFQDYAVTADGKELRLVFPLDRKWHDGEPVTMDDVIFTFEWLRDVKKAESLKTLTSIRKESGNQITLVFSGVDVYGFLRSDEASCPILPKHIWENVGSSYETFRGEGFNVGCGPYRLTGIDAASGDAVFEVFPGNGYLGDVKAEKIILRTYEDDTALLKALAEGEADFILYEGLLSGGQADIIKDKDGIDPGRTESGSFFYAVFGKEGPCGELKDLRRAVVLSLDWEQIRKLIGGDLGAIPGGGAVPPSASGYDESIAKFAQNRAEAAKLLDGLGIADTDEDGMRDMPDGTPLILRIVSDDIPGMQELADSLGQRMAEDLRKSGINAVYRKAEAPSQEQPEGQTPEGEQPAGQDPSEEQPAPAVWDIKIGRADAPAGSWDWSSVIQSDALVSAYDALRRASGESRYLEEMKFLQKLMSEELLGFALCWEEGFLPYRTDAYKGFSFFPGVGALNYETLYKLKEIKK